MHRVAYTRCTRVAVGTALASRPPRRSGRAAFPHPAPRSGHRGICGCRLPFALTALVCPALRPANGRSKRHCPCAAAFPPSPPPQLVLACSGTSTVLCSGPTAWVRPSSAFGHALPDAIGAGLLHRCGLLHGRCTQALPIPAHDVCPTMPRSSTPPDRYSPDRNGLRRVAFRALGPRRHPGVARLFRGSILGLTVPLSTLQRRRYHLHCMTRGRGGWLDPTSWGLAPLTSCRF
jgi:hypothetical protein